jgi:hypothetical protein
MKKFSLKDTTYGSDWLVVFGGELYVAINLFCKKFKIPHIEGERTDANRKGHFFTYVPFRGGLIWFRDIKISPGIIAHESLHATYYVLNHGLEAPLNDSTEEIYAYYHEWLVDSIHNKLK